MKKRYRVTSKFRLTVFLVVMFLLLTNVAGTLLGFNTVSSASLDQYSIVSVKSGDTLWNIASEYGPDDMDIREVVYDICDVNEISADELTAGSKIIVPIYQ